MKIRISVGVNVSEYNFSLEPEDLGFSEEEWNTLGEEEKKEEITVYIEEMQNQPFWMLDSFTENNNG